MLDPFADVSLSSFGFAGALGRSERQRDVLAAADTWVFDHLVPRRWHYILAGVATKSSAH
jgi:hypothetical protein